MYQVFAFGLAGVLMLGLTLGGAPVFASDSAAPPTMNSTGYSKFATTQATAALTDSPGGVVLSDIGQGGKDVVRAVCKDAPPTPYTITARMALTITDIASHYDWGGLMWRDANSEKMIGWGITTGISGVPGLVSTDFTNMTTWAGSKEASLNLYTLTLWLQLQDTGTTVNETYSMSNGGYYKVVTKSKSNGYLGLNGYNQICIALNAHSGATSLIVESYAETSP
jgi:hypothetical protein